MKKSHVLWPLVSASLAVSLSVGVLLGPTCLADNVISTGPFCSDCVLTNITFYSLGDFDAWASYVSNTLDSAMAIFGEYEYRVTRILVYCGTITNACDTILYNLDYIQASDEQTYKQAINSAVNDIRNAVAGSWNTGIIYQINALRDAMELSEADMQDVMGKVSAGLPRYRAEVATACSASPDGGGSGSTGCGCPDYTEYIDDIEDYLEGLSASVTNLESLVSSANSSLTRLRNLLQSFYSSFEQTAVDIGVINDSTYYFAVMALNLLDACDSSLNGSFSGDPEYAGTASGRWLGYVLYSQVVANNISTNIMMRLATRDWWDWAGHLHDTPDYQDLTDFLSVGIQGLTGLVMPYDDADAWPIVNAWRDYYYSRNVHPTNEVSNPLWVAFTNSVKLDPALLDSNRLKISVEAYSAGSLDSLANMLTNLTLSVSMVTNNVTVDVQNEYDTSVEILDEEMEETSDVDQDSVDMPSASVSFSGIGSVLTRVVNSYGSMFSIIPDEPPSDIVVYKGHSYHLPGQAEDFEVESIHWAPFATSRDGSSPESKVLNAIRVCFRFAWTVLYVILIYAAVAVDVGVVGICGYAVWGVLMGRTDAMVKGFLYCFKVVRRLLGV